MWWKGGRSAAAQRPATERRVSASEMVRQVTDLVTLSQKDLARAIGVSARTISNWRTDARLPHPDNLRALADWLQRHAESILAGAAAMRHFADRLEHPMERRALADRIEPRPEAKPEQRVPKGGPPQLRVRKGCSWRVPWTWLRGQ